MWEYIVLYVYFYCPQYVSTGALMQKVPRKYLKFRFYNFNSIFLSKITRFTRLAQLVKWLNFMQLCMGSKFVIGFFAFQMKSYLNSFLWQKEVVT